MTAADDIHKYFFHCFSEKIRLNVSSESSARQNIHMKNQASFSSKDKSKLDICVQRTRMPLHSVLSKMAPWITYWFLSDNYMYWSIKADLYNIEETNEGPCIVDHQDLHLVYSQT